MSVAVPVRGPGHLRSGRDLGAVNQVAFTAAGPVAGAAQGVATTTIDTTIYVGLVSYDGIRERRRS